MTKNGRSGQVIDPLPDVSRIIRSVLPAKDFWGPPASVMASSRPSGDAIVPQTSGLLDLSRTDALPSSVTFSNALSRFQSYARKPRGSFHLRTSQRPTISIQSRIAVLGASESMLAARAAAEHLYSSYWQPDRCARSTKRDSDLMTSKRASRRLRILVTH